MLCHTNEGCQAGGKDLGLPACRGRARFGHRDHDRRRRFPTPPTVLVSDGEEGIPDALASPATLWPRPRRRGPSAFWAPWRRSLPPAAAAAGVAMESVAGEAGGRAGQAPRLTLIDLLRLLDDLAAGARGPHQLPVPMDLAVLPARGDHLRRRRRSPHPASMVASGKRPGVRRMRRRSRVMSFPTLTMEGFRRPPAAWSSSESGTSPGESMAGRTEVMAATRQSSVARWYRSDESTTAGRCLLVLRSVNGNGTRTTSPRLQSVVGPILRVVPESEGRLGKVQPG